MKSSTGVIFRAFQDRLEQLGTHAIGHSERTLLDHLSGTCRLLESWSCPHTVCVAGLFHSVYGTSSFDRGRRTRAARETLAG